MALLNYGRTLGLAYKHDYKQWNDEMARQEQLNAAKKAQDQQKSAWIADKLKLGKTFTSFDHKQLQGFANERFSKVGKILQMEGWDTNPLAIAEISQISEELLDNPIIQRSARVNRAYENKVKDMTNPDLMEDEDARNQIIQSQNAFKNYDKYGNTAGIEGGPIEEFSYSTPSIFDVNEAFNEQSKFVGTREQISQQGGLLITSEVFTNMDEVVESLITGKKGKQFQRAYEKYKAAGGPNKSITDWARKNLEMRVKTNKSAQFVPGYGQGNGNGGDGKPDNDYFGMWVQTELDKATATVKGGAPFATSVPKNVHNFIPGATPLNNSGEGQVSIPTNSSIFVMNAKGERVELKTFSGNTMPVASYNKINTVNIGGDIGHYAEVAMIIDGEDNEIAEKLLDDGWFSDPKAKEGFQNQIRPQMKNGKVVPGKYIVMVNIPADFSPENRSTYNRNYNTSETQARVDYRDQQYNMAIQSFAQDKTPGIYPVKMIDGTIVNVEVSKDKKVKVVY